MSLRVFHRAPLQTGATIELEPEEAHYLTRVRRARPGDAIEVLDGTALAFAAEVVEGATVRLGAELSRPQLPPIEVAVGMPDPKASLEAVARACELGAQSVVLVRCDRSHSATAGADRIRRVVEASQRQCGRPDPPTVTDPVPLLAWLERTSGAPRYVAWTKMRGQPTAVDPVGKDGAGVLIGPEGGFCDSEVAAARGHGLRPMGLGPWTLRTEVAVVAALTRLLNR